MSRIFLSLFCDLIILGYNYQIDNFASILLSSLVYDDKIYRPMAKCDQRICPINPER